VELAVVLTPEPIETLVVVGTNTSAPE